MLVIGNAARAYPLTSVWVVTDQEPGKQPCPGVSWQKLTVCTGCPTPLESTRAVRFTLTVASCATFTLCGTRAMSSAVPSHITHPTNVVCTCWGLVYEAGASWVVIVMTPAVSGLTSVEAWPD